MVVVNFQPNRDAGDNSRRGGKRDSDLMSTASGISNSMKDNKILYSNKTRPKRTKSQEHLPTYKRTKSPSSEYMYYYLPWISYCSLGTITNKPVSNPIFKVKTAFSLRFRRIASSL